MQTATVIFCHGRESGPWGVKIRALARVAESRGVLVISRDDTDTTDPDERVSRLETEARALDGTVILAGSSMGGYVAAVAAERVRPDGLFLMAPAIGLPGYRKSMPQPLARELEIVHGWDDDVIPEANVLEFARRNRAALHLLPAGHALIEQVAWLAGVFGVFLDRCLGPESVAPVARLTATF